MVILNKDGSEYKLRGPNPIMKSQNLWDNFEIHNMNFDEVVDFFKKTSNKTTILNLNHNEIIIEDHGSSLVEKKEEIITEEPVALKKEDVKNENIQKDNLEKTNNSISNNFEIQKTIIHCLPATVSKKEDYLYGDIKKIIKYGEKFIFDGVLLEITDFQISFWTNIQLNNESVIYPKNSDKRWWKIIGSEPKFNGNIYFGKPSNVTPNFEN